MSEQVKVTYEGIDISYIEGRNEWDFVLRGRSRSAPSLAKAKEAIDKEPKPKKEFQRFECWIEGRDDKREKLTVTSFAGYTTYGRQPEWWTVDSRGARSKREQARLFAINDKNESIFKEIASVEAEAEALNKKAHQLRQTLERISAPEGTDVSQ